MFLFVTRREQRVQLVLLLLLQLVLLLLLQIVLILLIIIFLPLLLPLLLQNRFDCKTILFSNSSKCHGLLKQKNKGFQLVFFLFFFNFFFYKKIIYSNKE